MKPCDNCNKNISQYIDEGQVTCYLKCEKWKEWSEKRELAEQFISVSRKTFPSYEM